jgi:hypothetical protein
VNDIIIEVNRGFVEAVYTDLHDVRVTVIDWDSIGRDDGSGAVDFPVDHARLADLPPNTRTEYERRLHS